MITEDYVSFEIAKLLKEKGFKGECFTAYNGNGKLYKFGEEVDDNTPYWSDAPTLQMAMKWLREVHHYYIQVMFDTWAYGRNCGYYGIIQNTNSEFEIRLSDEIDKEFYDEPEEVCEAAIKYCLENLI